MNYEMNRHTKTFKPVITCTGDTTEIPHEYFGKTGSGYFGNLPTCATGVNYQLTLKPTGMGVLEPIFEILTFKDKNLF